MSTTKTLTKTPVAQARTSRDHKWYCPDARIRSEKAARQAQQIARWTWSEDGLEEEPTEETLFRALHTCAYRAEKLRRTNGETGAEKKRWDHCWESIREHIVRKNTGLVYSMINRVGANTQNEDDLISEGMYSLSRAVERFNPTKGYRFSTYACNAIVRSLLRRGQRENRYRQRFPVQYDAELERPTDDDSDDFQTDLYVERLQKVLDGNLADLTECEWRVLARRFPRDQKSRMTLKEIGEQVGVSKERVRQIQTNALGKLRMVLRRDPILK
jgi:RNA polymerase primary sigma factor